jgi:hypothetical protein
VRVLIQRASFARDSRFRPSSSSRVRTAKKFIDRAQNFVHVLKHLIVPKSKNSIAPRLQKRSANFIFPRKFTMLPAIEFDHEAPFDRAKVREVRSYRMLPPEFCLAHSAASQMTPEDSFRVGLRAPQPSGVPLRRFYEGHIW